MGGLPKAMGRSTFLVVVVVDRLSKAAHFIPLCLPYTERGIVEVSLTEVVRLYAFPSSIISDKDRAFMSIF